MYTKDTYFCEESFIHRLFLVLEILKREGYKMPSPPMATQDQKTHGK